MPPRLAPLKIRAEHLDRQALIYVRQSTPMQVRDNVASTARQYDLARRAEQFGWPRGRIHVIDQDQGHSGASTLGRDGFQYLMAEVGLGRVGAVLSLEASRLARSWPKPNNRVMNRKVDGKPCVETIYARSISGRDALGSRSVISLSGPPLRNR